MKLKDYLLLALSSLFLGWVLVQAYPMSYLPDKNDNILLNDTSISPPVDTTTSVKGKIVLFIGDSHTSNHGQGWQLQLSNAVGFNMTNASVGGKTTFWMLEQALYRINDNIDYCFVYGGANDMYGSISPQSAIENIKGIARICKGHGVKCVVLTGFDPTTCTKTKNPSYANKYSIFQRLLLSEDMDGATVIDTRVVSRSDCWDDLCHMQPSGHKKIAEKIIKDLTFKRI
jgi:lysophospholipase L1-like esterase